MNFSNNYAVQVQLAAGATSLALAGLADGLYILTLSDARGSGATRWEHLSAQVTAGVAVLARGQEGSADQDWPAGSWLYCSVTAGILSYLVSTVESLVARVYALEHPVVPIEAVTLTVYDGGDTLGYFDLTGDDNWVGEIDPAEIYWQGQNRQINTVTVTDDGLGSVTFQISLPDDITVEPVSIDVEGVGVLLFSEATRTLLEVPYPHTSWSWPIDSHDWASGAQRVLTMNNG